MDNLKIYYGVIDNYRDVSTITVEKCMKDGTIRIPCTDQQRADIYGDHIVGCVKHILIEYGDIRLNVRALSRIIEINCLTSETIKESLEDYMHWDKVIPIYIIAFNNYSYVKNMIEQLQRFTKNIVIIDNGTTYPILLEYYKQTGITVVYYANNYNVQSTLYEVIDIYTPDYYIITDPDLQLADNMSLEVLERLKSLVDKYGTYKAGLALEIEGQKFKNIKFIGHSIYNWEKQFWNTPVEPGVYRAPIDTTFTLCCKHNFRGNRLDAIRLADGYQCKHLPWYDPPIFYVPQEETNYYRATQKQSSWNR